MGPEKKILSSHNNQNTKCTEQRTNIKAAREKIQVTYKGRSIRFTQLFNRDYEGQKSLVLQTLREYKCHLRLLYLAKISINIDGETKIFQDKTKFQVSTYQCSHKEDPGRKAPTQGRYLHQRKDKILSTSQLSQNQTATITKNQLQKQTYQEAPVISL